jgi:hypothetical protein
VDEGGCGSGEQLNLKAIRRPEGRRYKSKTVLGRDDSAWGDIEERSFVAKGAPQDDGQGPVRAGRRSAAEPDGEKR